MYDISYVKYSQTGMLIKDSEVDANKCNLIDFLRCVEFCENIGKLYIVSGSFLKIKPCIYGGTNSNGWRSPIVRKIVFAE